MLSLRLLSKKIENWVKVFKNGPNKIFQRLSSTILPILLGLFLNTINQLIFFWSVSKIYRIDGFEIFLDRSLQKSIYDSFEHLKRMFLKTINGFYFRENLHPKYASGFCDLSKEYLNQGKWTDSHHQMGG